MTKPIIAFRNFGKETENSL